MPANVHYTARGTLFLNLIIDITNGVIAWVGRTGPSQASAVRQCYHTE